MFYVFQTTLNKFMSLGYAGWHETRQTLQSILSKDQGVLRDNAELQAKCLVPQSEVTMHLPANIGIHLELYLELV
jgi:fumarylacetoacetase